MNGKFYFGLVLLPLVVACGAPAADPIAADSGDAVPDEGAAPSMGSAGGDWTAQDECALGTHACHEDADCIDTPGYYTCACKAGYVGDGLSCSDVDECALGIDECADNANCQNEAGSYSCACDAGFVGDGVSCLASYSQLSAGSVHSCAIRSDKTAWCWGSGRSGRLGIGSSSNRDRPSQVIGGDWAQVDGGGSTSCGIKTDGSLWCWGYGSNGALGLPGAPAYKSKPAPLEAGGDWQQLSLGYSDSCAIKTSGALYCWGRNSYGQAGVAGKQKVIVPTAIEPTAKFAAIEVGYSHSCAIKQDGTLWCWGRNHFGQLGIGSSDGEAFEPQQVGSDEDWSAIALGHNHSCGLKTDGRLWCWGQGYSGQLGLGDALEWTVPQAVDELERYRLIAAQRQLSCGVRTDGSLWCWGSGENGELGETQGGSVVPVLVSSDTDWEKVELGDQHVCGLRASGRVSCWGSTTYGQTGVGIISQRVAPRTVDGGALTWDVLSLAYDRSCAIGQDGTLWCWGRNQKEVLGLGHDASVRVPQQLGSASDWRSVSLGGKHSCALREDGSETSLWCWGDNSKGQLGSGDSAYFDALTPMKIGSATDWSTVSAGSWHSCGLTEAGALYCWGKNDHGQLGDGSQDVHDTPQVIAAGKSFVQVAAGAQHSCAIKNDGSLWCWGDNSKGQLGLGDELPRFEPTAVGSDLDWSGIEVGVDYSCALKHSGALYCWGQNKYGQLGLGFKDEFRSSPEKVIGADWERVSIGVSHSCGIKTDGSLWCWGGGSFGVLGTGDTSQTSSPIQVGSETNWARVAVAASHTCALTDQQQLRCWGSSVYGKTGHGDGWDPEARLILEP